MGHWLTTFVLPKAEYSAISTLTGAFIGILIVAPFRGVVKKMRGRISSAIDSLDPDVPVGLTKQLDAMTSELDAMRQRLEGHLHVEVKDAPLDSHRR